MDTVICERHEGWAEVILNRPERRNAIDGQLARDLGQALRSLQDDREIRAIVLRGAGGAFCSGLDLKAFSATPEPAWKATFPADWDEVHRLLLTCPQVLIVALERFAINGAAALAIAADFLIVGEQAFLQVGEIQIGMAAPRNLAWLALRHTEAVAARIALLGDKVPAPELYRLGVASEVVADDAVLARAGELAARIGAYPAPAVAACKQGLRAATARMPAGEWLRACTAALPEGANAGTQGPPPRA